MSDNSLIIKSREGYTFKVLVELLQRYIRDGCFIIDKKGICLTGKDTKTEKGTKLICINLPRTNFLKYKCSGEPLNIGLNMVHFYRMLKSIKKKDTLTLFIKNDDPLNLYIQIHQNGEEENKAAVKSIKITQVRPLNHDIPMGYEYPIIATSKEFQKIKTLNKISKVMQVTAKSGKIEFFCDKEDVYTCKVPFGDIDEENENENNDNDNENYVEEYKQTFDAEQILDIVKMANMSSTIQIYASQELPLHFKMNVGSLGTVELYIKSRENIAEEEEESHHSNRNSSD